MRTIPRSRHNPQFNSQELAKTLARCLFTDPAIGVVRHAQAGYPKARAAAEGNGPLTDESINVPLWWTPRATFGPEGAGGSD